MELRGSTSLLLLVCSIEISCLLLSVYSEVAAQDSFLKHGSSVMDGSDFKRQQKLQDCVDCNGKKGIYLTVTYVDRSGIFRAKRMHSSGLSASWVWQNANDNIQDLQNAYSERRRARENDTNGSHQNPLPLNVEYLQPKVINSVKLQRQRDRQKRKELRAARLMQQDKDTDERMEEAAIQHARQFDTTTRGKYSIWRREFENPRSDSTLKLMKDQIIMLKVYASIARSKKQNDMYDSLMKHIRQTRKFVGEAHADSELKPGATRQAKEMGHVLSLVKDRLYDCSVVARKLRAMIQRAEENVTNQKKKGTFLIQLAAKTVPKPLNCLALQLTSDYYLHDYKHNESIDIAKLEDPNLYHYAIFSDNVLATSVVVNSTVLNAKEPRKHVFHIVTDRLNFAAMKMWFLIHPPHGATIHVENIDEFKWLNSSYCPVLRQLESSRMKEYYFKMNHPSSLSVGNENLKYRNPKYLSMLNHLRFYMPEIYPKLDKLLFLDDDVVVQKDLTPLWSVDLKGMVNGAVETCKESFHRLETYLNFSNPLISKNFSPKSCGWAFGMNMFDLKEWRKRNITGIYHHWQNLNEDRLLWKLGTLPPGLITFYNLTYPLDQSWHVLGLGYDPAVEVSKVQAAAVIHYNGNYKPWLDLALSKYRKYWSKYVMFENPYLKHCHINQAT